MNWLTGRELDYDINGTKLIGDRYNDPINQYMDHARIIETQLHNSFVSYINSSYAPFYNQADGWRWP
jgi:hypothetical protein